MKKRLVALLAGALVATGAWAADDGSQLASPFRVNYLGYFQHGPKIALHLSAEGGSLAWSLKDAAGKAVASGDLARPRGRRLRLGRQLLPDRLLVLHRDAGPASG